METSETITDHGLSLSPSACILLEGLDKRWGKFRAQLERCQQEFGEEAVHDLRVAARRLMATLAMCKIVVPNLKVKKLREDIKSHLDSLDELRDTQVMILFVRKKFKKDVNVQGFLAYLKLNETSLIQKANWQINDLNQEKITAKIERIRNQLNESLSGQDVAWNILTAVDHAFAEVLWHRVGVNPEKVKTIHQTRIAFKKFRYMVEVASPLVTNLPEKHLKSLQAYQTMMGNIQDMDVMLSAVEIFSADHPEFDMSALKEAVNTLRTERIEYFLARMDRVKRHWRHSPVSPFPWKSANQPADSRNEAVV